MIELFSEDHVSQSIDPLGIERGGTVGGGVRGARDQRERDPGGVCGGAGDRVDQLDVGSGDQVPHVSAAIFDAGSFFAGGERVDADAGGVSGKRIRGERICRGVHWFDCDECGELGVVRGA